jgi:hypothetical protein
LAVRCEQYHFGLLWCILIQNLFGSANDHPRERWVQFKIKKHQIYE